MADELTTQVLVSQAQAGSNTAVETLCRRYQQRVLAAVRLRLGNRLRCKMESWDLVQDAMIDAFRGIKAFDFRTEGAFLKYVIQIVENRIRDAAQRWNTQRRTLDREQPLDAEGSSSIEPLAARISDSAAATPSGVVSLREDLALLEKAMDRLGDESPEDRELLIAIKLEGRTYGEVAAELSISDDAVRMRARRALDTLSGIFRRLESQGIVRHEPTG